MGVCVWGWVYAHRVRIVCVFAGAWKVKTSIPLLLACLLFVVIVPLLATHSHNVTGWRCSGHSCSTDTKVITARFHFHNERPSECSIPGSNQQKRYQVVVSSNSWSHTCASGMPFQGRLILRTSRRTLLILDCLWSEKKVLYARVTGCLLSRSHEVRWRNETSSGKEPDDETKTFSAFTLTSYRVNLHMKTRRSSYTCRLTHIERSSHKNAPQFLIRSLTLGTFHTYMRMTLQFVCSPYTYSSSILHTHPHQKFLSSLHLLTSRTVFTPFHTSTRVSFTSKYAAAFTYAHIHSEWPPQTIE